jgi:peptidoglycan/LPS O-acetylase OafA/YrhL
LSPTPSLATPSPARALGAGYLPALDLVRVVALAGVVLTHVIAWAGRDGPESETWGRTIELLARSGVPCFLLLSGLLLGRASDRPEPPTVYLQRRWLRMGAPWLVWGVVWLLAYLWVADGLKGLERPVCRTCWWR